jgi:hypothetical protein
MKVESTWTVYRSRFVVRARQLTECLVFTDALGREHSGQPGDYLVESLEGLSCIRPQAQFESIYVPLQESPNPTSRAGFKLGMPDVLIPQTLPTRLPAPVWTG